MLIIFESLHLGLLLLCHVVNIAVSMNTVGDNLPIARQLTPNQLVLSPTPAHRKSGRRVANSRIGNVQPVPPNSSRGMSQHED